MHWWRYLKHIQLAIILLSDGIWQHGSSKMSAYSFISHTCNDIARVATCSLLKFKLVWCEKPIQAPLDHLLRPSQNCCAQPLQPTPSAANAGPITGWHWVLGSDLLFDCIKTGLEQEIYPRAFNHCSCLIQKCCARPLPPISTAANAGPMTGWLWVPEFDLPLKY